MSTALIVIDMQVDFCPGGALAVPEGDAVVADVNRLMRAAGTVVLTQDWHPADHLSFAASHPGAAPFETRTMPYGAQVLWPVHCVQDRPGARMDFRALAQPNGGGRLELILTGEKKELTQIAPVLARIGAQIREEAGLAQEPVVKGIGA